MPPRISIITVCLNSAQTIRDTLISVASQDFHEVEHLIIDGGSRDGTLEVVRAEAGPCARLVSEPDLGIYDAMNKGIGLATGDVVGFLNADDTFAGPHVLQRVCEVMSRPGVDACYGDLVYVDSADPSRIVRYWKSGPFRPGSFSRGWVPPHPTFFTRASTYRQHGSFDLRYRLAADFDLLVRLFEGRRIAAEYLPEVLVRMRTGGATNKNLLNIFKQNLEICRALYRNGVPPSPFFAVSKVAARLRQRMTRFAGAVR
jgi:glycosyltransferase involved in cell wall biosynthesis